MPDLTVPQAAMLSSVLICLTVALFLYWVTPLWDRLTANHLADLTPRMADLNMSTTHLPGLLRIWAGVMFGAAALGLLLGVPMLTIPVVFLIYRVPRFLVRQSILRRRVLLRDQLVAGSTALANATRAGLALPQGVEAILPETPVPLADEFRRVHNEYLGGRPFAECLREAQLRLNLDAFTLFSAALLVCIERGGKVTEALDRISESLQENQRLERKLEADTASGQMVINILALCPAGFLGLFLLMTPESTSLLFTELLGQLILLVVCVLVYAAVSWARSILKLDGRA